jgi:hypothetical protein
MVWRRFFSAVSNHEARGPSIETPRKGAAPQDEARLRYARNEAAPRPYFSSRL